MSAKAIYEGKGKELLNQFLTGEAMKNKFAIVEENVNWSQLVQDNPWLNTQVGVVSYIYTLERKKNRKNEKKKKEKN